MVEQHASSSLSDILDEALKKAQRESDIMNKSSDLESVVLEDIFRYGMSFGYTYFECIERLPLLTKWFWEERGI